MWAYECLLPVETPSPTVLTWSPNLRLFFCLSLSLFFSLTFFSMRAHFVNLASWLGHILFARLMVRIVCELLPKLRGLASHNADTARSRSSLSFSLFLVLPRFSFPFLVLLVSSALGFILASKNTSFRTWSLKARNLFCPTLGLSSTFGFRGKQKISHYRRNDQPRWIKKCEKCRTIRVCAT